ncbi:hypothetical protein SEA_BOOSTSEASON_52 [Mycobacterium phage BoostSeason]|uniref:Uncharacterized protein n=2 Tax=Timquatrovirus TaxID=1623306 RepID=A0A0M4R017_9CAUD|nr:hypothetical protein SEA_MUFASA_52 [Mycobacterium phage Mufasa]YP_009951138.1 hypothetical protein I5G77_gp52 [Mycobacterium phage Findley]AOZ64389.1 hypothetical protein SEA_MARCOLIUSPRIME_52 [Mycobacterium phage Marcoliusprime]ASR86595.1 hypothetical protein SEA_DISMALFUNK_52 [Mycobacterium phage DismalFunk]AYB69006.1 hypothetical protein SEA_DISMALSTRESSOR_52 [Mycobacterium phage DismalStressor]AYN57225.1 hypothetical protein SEA_BOOSTSEASON_52 [Mycobacterium phage BoostSeason]ALF00486.
MSDLVIFDELQQGTGDEPRDYVPAFERAVLYAMQFKPMYEGTVPHRVRAKRRERNRVARRSRKINRKAS